MHTSNWACFLYFFSNPYMSHSNSKNFSFTCIIILASVFVQLLWVSYRKASSPISITTTSCQCHHSITVKGTAHARNRIICTQSCHPVHSCMNMRTCCVYPPNIEITIVSEDFGITQKFTEQTHCTQFQ